MAARRPGEFGRELIGLLVEHALAGRPGILTASKDKLKRLFCLKDGKLIYGTSNVLEEQFAERMVESDLITPAERASAVRAAHVEKQKLVPLLIEQNLVDEASLRSVMEEQIRGLFSSCLDWSDGEAAFEVGQPNLDGEVTASISPVTLVLEHTRRHPSSIEALRARLGRPDRCVERSPAADRFVAALEGEQIARRLLDHCNGGRPLAELLGSSPDGEEATLRALYALRLLGVLVPVEADEAEAQRAAERPVTRDEVLGRLLRIEKADYYMVLDLDHGATRDQIIEAYYGLARRLHPDRFRSGALQDLLPKVEEFFSKVTEAYNTLYDPTLRQHHDARLKADEKKTETEQDTGYLAKQNFLRGKVLAEKRRFNEALKFFENAVKLAPDQVEYRLEMGLLLTHNPRMRGECERNLLRVVELQPTATRAYLALGGLYQRARRAEHAARCYREVLRWEPQHQEAVKRLRALREDPGKAAEGGALKPLFGE